jgi:hypothetical protein
MSTWQQFHSRFSQSAIDQVVDSKGVPRPTTASPFQQPSPICHPDRSEGEGSAVRHSDAPPFPFYNPRNHHPRTPNRNSTPASAPPIIAKGRLSIQNSSRAQQQPSSLQKPSPICHPDRSEAEGRDLQCAIRMPHLFRSTTTSPLSIAGKPTPDLPTRETTTPKNPRLPLLQLDPTPRTGAPCLHRRSRSTTWVEQAGAKPLPYSLFPQTKSKQTTRSAIQRTTTTQEPPTSIPLPLFLNLHHFCTSPTSPQPTQRTKLNLSHG